MATFVRWVPKRYGNDAINRGFISHNKSALWIFDLEQRYRAGNNIANRNSVLIRYILDETATQNIKMIKHVEFESGEFKGEAKHPMEIIVKNNEVGAYGVGKSRQHFTNHHVRTRYATRKETAKALGLNELEVEPYKPQSGWGQ